MRSSAKPCVAALIALSACGNGTRSDSASGGGGTGAEAGTPSSGGTTANAGGSTSGGGSGPGAGGSAGTAAVIECLSPMSPATGDVLSVYAPTGVVGGVRGLKAACDGSFASVGDCQSNDPFSFELASGETVTFSDSLAIWVVRFNPEGMPVWVNHHHAGYFMGYSNESHVGISPDGALAVVGTFGGEAVFAEGEPNETAIVAEENGYPEYAAYVARYSPDGHFEWARRLGDGALASTGGVDVDDSGTIYAALAWTDLATVLAPGELDLPLGDGEGAIVALAPDGTYLRAVRHLVTRADDLTVLADGGVVLGVECDGAILALGTPEQTSLSCADTAYARFDASLQLTSVFELPTAAYLFASRVIRDGSLLIAGEVGDSVTLGTGGPNETVLTPLAAEDMYLAKFGGDGALEWATQISGSSVAIERTDGLADGSVWILARYASANPGEIVLGANGAAPLTLSFDARQTFVARFSALGEPLWATRFDADGSILSDHLAASQGGVVAAGEFSGTATFGAPPSQTLTSSLLDAYFVKFGP